MPNRNLSGLEQQLYFVAREAKHGIATVGVLAGLRLCSRQTLHVMLNRMVRKKWLVRVKRGIYAVAPDYFQPARGVEDVFYTAQLVYPGYLAFSTALYLHGLLEETPFTLYVATNDVSGKKVMPGGFEVQAVALGRTAVGAQHKEGGYALSTKAKTLFDCLRFPEYAGGYSRITNAFFTARLHNAEWREFARYFQAFASKALAQKTGYLLELLAAKASVRVPRFLERVLKEKSGSKKVVLNGVGGAAVSESKQWRVIDCIGERRLLHWLRG